jgi:hypothetical protein
LAATNSLANVADRQHVDVVLAASTRAAWSFCMATALHVPILLVAAAPAAPRRPVRAMSFDVSMVSVVDPSSVAPLSPAPSVSIAARAVSPRAVVSRVVESRPAPSVAPAESLPDQPAVAVDPLPAPAPVQRDLSPLAAARSLPLEPNGPVSVSREAGVRPESEARVEARLAEGIPGLKREAQRVRDRSVGELAQDLRTVALRPWDLVRQPLLHYRYRFRGIGFDAVIQADGTVKYRDKHGLHLAITQVVAAKEDKEGDSPFTVVPSVGLGDLSTWSEKLAGNDPHAAERRKFLDQTRALREYLRDRAERRAREAQDGRVEQ